MHPFINIYFVHIVNELVFTAFGISLKLFAKSIKIDLWNIEKNNLSHGLRLAFIVLVGFQFKFSEAPFFTDQELSVPLAENLNR